MGAENSDLLLTVFENLIRMLPFIILAAVTAMIVMILARPEDHVNRAVLKKRVKARIEGKKSRLFTCSFLAGLLCCIPVVNIVIGSALSLGLARIYLGVARGRKPEIGDIFSGTQLLGRAWALSFLTGLYTFLWALIPVVGVWLSVEKRLSYSMSIYILAENPHMTVGGAIEESKRMMEGHKLDLLALEVSFIGWNLLGVVTVGLVFIFYTNYYYAVTRANFYLEVKKQWRKSGSRDSGSDVRTKVGPGARYKTSKRYDHDPESVSDELVLANCRIAVPDVGRAPPHVRHGIIHGTSGMYKGADFPITENEELVFGRSAEQCQIVISQGAEKISRRHMSVSIDSSSGDYIVTDFSSNGTFLSDGTSLKPNTPTLLYPGATVYLANQNNTFRLG